MIVELCKSVRKRMLLHLAKAGVREIGGILMAEQIKPGEFRIIDFSVDAYTGGPSHFVRSANHHHEALDDFFEETGGEFSRFNYLGEWHSHPNHSLHPSATDIASMRALLVEEQKISFSILLIVKRKWWGRLDCAGLLFCDYQSPQKILIHQEI